MVTVGFGENSKLEKLQCKIGFYLSSNAANNFCAKILSACKKTLEYSLRIKSALIFHKSLDLSRYDLSKLQMHEPSFRKLSHSDQKSQILNLTGLRSGHLSTIH